MTKGEARIVEPQRDQLGWEMVDIDGLLQQGHAARLVWTFVTQMDLRQFYAAIGSREGDAGRPAADPRVLLALWLYAAVEGVGSARELERLVERDVAYRWIAGGVPVNYHGLSDFRTRHGSLLDTLLTESVMAPMAEGLVKFEEVIADGTKVQAAAERVLWRSLAPGADRADCGGADGAAESRGRYRSGGVLAAAQGGSVAGGARTGRARGKSHCRPG